MLPPLPAASGALEGEDQRMLLLEARVAHQLRELALPLRQLLLVVFFFQHLREVEFGKHRFLSMAGTSGGATGTLPRLPCARCLRIESRTMWPDGQRTIVVVGALDDGPRGMGGIGHAQHVAGNRLQLVVRS